MVRGPRAAVSKISNQPVQGWGHRSASRTVAVIGAGEILVALRYAIPDCACHPMLVTTAVPAATVTKVRRAERPRSERLERTSEQLRRRDLDELPRALHGRLPHVSCPPVAVDQLGPRRFGTWAGFPKARGGGGRYSDVHFLIRGAICWLRSRRPSAESVGRLG